MEQELKLMKTKIFLTGFRSAGKTTLAKLLSEKLNFELIEMDSLIVKRAKKSIAEITKNGKEWYRFRILENEVLKDLIKKEDIVVATGGGVFVNEVEFSKGKTFGEYNYNLVKNIIGKFIIFLKVNKKILKERLNRGESENYNKKWRPSLTGDSKIDIQKEMEVYKKRLPFYEKRADLIINTSKQTSEESLNEILRTL